MAFGLILLSFLLSFCYRFVSRKFSPFVGHTYTWSSQKGWRSISSCIRTSGSYSTRRAPLANLTRASGSAWQQRKVCFACCGASAGHSSATPNRSNAKHVTNMDESHTTSARIMMVTYVDTYIHITYVYIYIYMYTHMHVYIYIYVYIILSVIVFFFLIVLRWMDYTRYKKATCNTKSNWRGFFNFLRWRSPWTLTLPQPMTLSRHLRSWRASLGFGCKKPYHGSKLATNTYL